MALLTAAEARFYIRGLAGTAEDTALDALISRVGAAFARWCGYPAPDSTSDPTLETAAYTRYYDGPDPADSRVLRLGIWPVQSVASIYDDPTWDYGASHLVDSADYDLDAEGGLVLLKPDSSHGRWSRGYRAIKATFTAGYSTVPSDLKHACGLQVAHIWKGRDSIGVKSVSEAGVSISPLSMRLLPEVRQLLAPYRLPGVFGAG